MKNIVAELDLTENWDKIFNLLNDGLMIVAPDVKWDYSLYKPVAGKPPWVQAL